MATVKKKRKKAATKKKAAPRKKTKAVARKKPAVKRKKAVRKTIAAKRTVVRKRKGHMRWGTIPAHKRRVAKPVKRKKAKKKVHHRIGKAIHASKHGLIAVMQSIKNPL